jgi:hypothetical protein
VSTQEDATGSHHSFSARIQLFYELNANFSAVLFFATVVCWQMLHCGVAFVYSLALLCNGFWMQWGCNVHLLLLFLLLQFCFQPGD